MPAPERCVNIVIPSRHHSYPQVAAIAVTQPRSPRVSVRYASKVLAGLRAPLRFQGGATRSKSCLVEFFILDIMSAE